MTQRVLLMRMSMCSSQSSETGSKTFHYVNLQLELKRIFLHPGLFLLPGLLLGPSPGPLPGLLLGLLPGLSLKIIFLGIETQLRVSL